MLRGTNEPVEIIRLPETTRAFQRNIDLTRRTAFPQSNQTREIAAIVATHEHMHMIRHNDEGPRCMACPNVTGLQTRGNDCCDAWITERTGTMASI